MIKKTREFYRQHRKKFITLLLAITIVELIFLPLNFSPESLHGLPEFSILLLFSELFFIVGLALMAFSVEHDLGPNPFKWRKNIKKLMQHVPSDKKFWLGFYINMFGALATGLVFFIGIILFLPVEAWGVLWIPVFDIIVTLLLRASILQLRKEALLLNE